MKSACLMFSGTLCIYAWTRENLARIQYAKGPTLIERDSTKLACYIVNSTLSNVLQISEVRDWRLL